MSERPSHEAGLRVCDPDHGRSNGETLAGRRILVTGAAGTIGESIATQVADRGGEPILLDVPSPALDELGDRLSATTVPLDLTDASAIRTFFRTQEDQAPMSGVVNAAGKNTRTPFCDLTDDEWNHVLAVNLTAAFVVTQCAAAAMRANGVQGSIVNIGSIGAWQAYVGLVHYESAKAGLHALTRGAALDLAEHRIRVNAVAPGVVSSNMTRVTLEDPEVRARRLAKIPMGRFGDASDVAEVACFLLSDSSKWVTGSVVTVDGGQSLV